MRTLRAYGLLAGGIIGVGIFGLPASALEVGFLVFALMACVLAFVVWVISDVFAEIVRVTPERHRIPGYAAAHLGVWGGRLATVANIGSLLGAQLAYLLAGGAFLRLALEPFLLVTPFQATALYCAVGALLVLRGVGKVAMAELLIMSLFVITLLFLAWESRTVFDVSHLLLTKGGSPLTVYGVLLFAFWGMPIVPDAVEQAGRIRGSLRIALAGSIGTALMVYVFFSGLILGVTGEATTPAALDGLHDMLGPTARMMGLSFGLLTTFSSFLALGLVLRDTLTMDFRVPSFPAWCAGMGVPFALYAIGLRELLIVMSISGALFTGLEGVTVLFMAFALRGKGRLISAWSHPFVLVSLAGLLMLGMALVLAHEARAFL